MSRDDFDDNEPKFIQTGREQGSHVFDVSEHPDVIIIGHELLAKVDATRSSDEPITDITSNDVDIIEGEDDQGGGGEDLFDFEVTLEKTTFSRDPVRGDFIGGEDDITATINVTNGEIVGEPQVRWYVTADHFPRPTPNIWNNGNPPDDDGESGSGGSTDTIVPKYEPEFEPAIGTFINIPWQAYLQDETVQVGVAAYHLEGMNRVEFYLAGPDGPFQTLLGSSSQETKSTNGIEDIGYWIDVELDERFRLYNKGNSTGRQPNLITAKLIPNVGRTIELAEPIEDNPNYYALELYKVDSIPDVIEVTTQEELENALDNSGGGGPESGTHIKITEPGEYLLSTVVGGATDIIFDHWAKLEGENNVCGTAHHG